MTYEDEEFVESREQMVRTQLVERGIKDPLVLKAFRTVWRHRFVPEDRLEEAYEDKAIPIGRDQSISQPYIVALMLEALRLEPHFKVLDIGAGSGYQAALLSVMVKEVYGVEVDSALAERTAELLNVLNYKNVQIKSGDGFKGWPENAPFDGIVVGVAADEISRSLVRQLNMGGRMVFPLGEEKQFLVLIEKTPDGIVSKDLGAVRFVTRKSVEDTHE